MSAHLGSRVRPPYRPCAKNLFRLEFSILDEVWPSNTKLIVRGGAKESLVIDSPHRLTNRPVAGSGNSPCDSVELTADRGYILWTNPRGSAEVKFKYGKSGQDFRCFVDPENLGVGIYEVRGYSKELIIDGKEPIEKSKNPHHCKKSPVRPGQNNFQFQSREGVVTLMLEANREFPQQHAFKMSYVLVL